MALEWTVMQAIWFTSVGDVRGCSITRIIGRGALDLEAD